MPQNAVHFGAKRSAFWCKTQCVLMLNAVRFDAKRKVKWGKTQGKMPLNARRKSINIHSNCINKTFRTLKYIAERGKIVVKKWDFRG